MNDVTAGYTIYRDRVRPEWVTTGDHMNAEHYKTLLANSRDLLWDTLGLGIAYYNAMNCAPFQAEEHIRYERELALSDPVLVKGWIVAWDAKRIHHFHEVFHETKGYRAVTCEILAIFVDLTARRVTPMPAPLHDTIRRFTARAVLPQGYSRRIAIEPK